MSSSGQSIIYNDNRLSYVSQDALYIPVVLGRMFGNKVTSLDLSFNKISSLNGLEFFSDLFELMLDNNNLDDNISFPHFSNLHTLSLNNNEITNLEYFLLKVKKSFPNIKYLSILGNKACPSQISHKDKDEEDYQRYRYFVLYMLPGLDFLDSKVVTLEERFESKHRGMYSKIARPSYRYDVKEPLNERNSKYSPLPAFPVKSHHGIYGKCVYQYNGKQSEGNRFIRNKDL